MISVFAEDRTTRFSITWNGIDYNMPDVPTTDGVFTDHVAFDTPTNFQSEVHQQISKSGGGIEFYNPRAASRVLSFRCRILAPTLAKLMDRCLAIQAAHAPLNLQFWENRDRLGTLQWPVTNGMPSWVKSVPLQFTRLVGGSLWSRWITGFPNGEALLEYHVAPLALPDPILGVVGQGYGAFLSPSWLVLDGGRAYARAEETLSGDGDITPTWAVAPMWPQFTFTATGVPLSNLTIAVTAGSHSETLVVNAAGCVNNDTVVIDTETEQIRVNGIEDPAKCSYVSGNWPVLRGEGNTDTVTWTNNANTTSRVTRYRQADYA